MRKAKNKRTVRRQSSLPNTARDDYKSEVARAHSKLVITRQVKALKRRNRTLVLRNLKSRTMSERIVELAANGDVNQSVRLMLSMLPKERKR